MICAISKAGARGSILIIVMWVSFGLVTLALYFAHAMSFEMRVADNRVAALEAEQTILGAARYVSNLLATATEKGVLPERNTYLAEAVSVGEGTFWFIGAEDEITTTLSRTVDGDPLFGLVDESSKLHLNSATLEMLQMLPGMTTEFAAAIVDWRDSDDEPSDGGAEAQVYLRRTPAYSCKNAVFETVSELRLVYGAELDLLYGEDANLNGFLDRNENDGDVSNPLDDRDGTLDRGVLSYLTIYTSQPAGTNVNNRQQLEPLLQSRFSADRANQILARVAGTTNNSVLQFYLRSEMTAEEFLNIEGDISVSDAPAQGLVNVNTASEEVLACIPGIGTDKAPALVAYRRSNTGKRNTVTWVRDVLDDNQVAMAGRYLTGRTYQYLADIAAVGRFYRGYRRIRMVFDMSNGTPVILFRQDLTHLGWALGHETRNRAENLNNFL